MCTRGGGGGSVRSSVCDSLRERADRCSFQTQHVYKCGLMHPFLSPLLLLPPPTPVQLGSVAGQSATFQQFLQQHPSLRKTCECMKVWKYHGKHVHWRPLPSLPPPSSPLPSPSLLSPPFPPPSSPLPSPLPPLPSYSLRPLLNLERFSVARPPAHLSTTDKEDCWSKTLKGRARWR